ncbi:hypothetical protein SCP_1401250 [Sparassis crispa]|uniref:DUF6534 domain-containing protein n=1 Tax=Sparassis crispa TaxID=139825 RepID=A0A401H2X8_9APHY|nr:hypothetical protein SCP_1401250 [Sparassis crispa]GBE88720.1 hypothetical protein SCP_1401250 [Sparassis crispa]
MMTTASIGLYIHSVYWFLVINFDNTAVINGDMPWTLLSQSALMGFMSFLVRCMFARRLWRLSQYDFAITAGVIALSAANLFSLTILTVESITNLHSSGPGDLKKILEAAFATSVAADVSLTAALCYFLYRSRTHIRETDEVLSELTLYTFNTGLLVVVDIVISLVLFLTSTTASLVFIPTYIVSAVLYFNSFLLSLNARREFRNKLDNSIHVLAAQHPALRSRTLPPTPSPSPPSTEESGDDVIHICVRREAERVSAATV